MTASSTRGIVGSWRVSQRPSPPYVDGDQVADVVREERAPGLRRREAPLRHQPGHGVLSDVNSDLQEFAMDFGRAPQGIGCGLSGNQSADFRGDRGRPTTGRRESRVQ